ncbi:response regulator transcription factor [Cohnella fermenti]|uniref:Response regulator n=1 Tax=Cohnella fermenti TaxID=2565925 RepID=A0A4S4C1T9_9BACL|nr:response regulator [Cohnella fermenti]THF81624.1 response regulator [Cohnella fermenti]
MYKALIADDDILVRMDLRSMIDWHKLGIELTDDAANGEEAVRLARETQPDLLLLDIEMPLMNGLEVIQRLKEDRFDGKIVVLSCHDDFDIVKEALKNGASEYLLKHMLKPDNLIAVLQTAIGDLEELHASRNEQMLIRHLTERGKPALREELLKELFAGVWRDREQAAEAASKLDLRLGFARYVVAAIEIDDMYRLRSTFAKSELNGLLKSVLDVIDATLPRTASIFGRVDEGVYGILVDYRPEESFMSVNNRIFETCETILDNIGKYLNIQASAGISRIGEGPAIADQLFMQAKLALEGKLYCGKSKVIHYSELDYDNGNPNLWLAEPENDRVRAILADTAKIDDYFNSIFSGLRLKPVKPVYIRQICLELLMFLNTVAKEYKLSYSEVFGFDYVPYDYVIGLETLEDIEGWFSAVCRRINGAFATRISNVDPRHIRLEIRRAIEYIDKNYGKEISLQEIADHCHLSRTYFSQIFCLEMKESFSDYLSRYRIERAKYLLMETDLKIYEVGAACGLPNYRYFTKLFKDLTGVSPGKFKGGTP